jgi:hypothetical protein
MAREGSIGFRSPCASYCRCPPEGDVCWRFASDWVLRLHQILEQSARLIARSYGQHRTDLLAERGD